MEKKEAIVLNQIAEIRKRLGYSQAQLADMLRVSQSAVSQWELGKTLPDVQTAQTLALVFGVTIDDLLNDTDYDTQVGMTISRIRKTCGYLNEIGKQKVLDYIDDLVCSGKYKPEPNIPDDA